MGSQLAAQVTRFVKRAMDAGDPVLVAAGELASAGN